MDPRSTGSLICRLRKEQGLTQRQLAEAIHVSDKAVSKWERGMGCPDVSLLPALARHLDVSLEVLLSGQLDSKDPLGGNMKNLRFYICPACGNVVTAVADAAVSCCGKPLTAHTPGKAGEEERLQVERIEEDYFISTDHPMKKDHYISFVALLTGDSILLRKQYPEWDLQLRLPAFAHGRLLWYCTQHGLFYQNI